MNVCLKCILLERKHSKRKNTHWNNVPTAALKDTKHKHLNPNKTQHKGTNKNTTIKI